MTERCVLLVGTPKGAFVLDGDAGRRDWTLRGPLCEGWPIHDISVEPGTGALLAGGGSPWYGPAVWRSDDLGETWTHSERGPHVRRRRPEGRDGLERDRDPTTRSTRASSPPACSGAATGGRTWEHVEGLTNHPTPRRVGAGRRRPDPALHRPPPRRTRTACGSGSRRSACSRPATAARPGRRATRASGPASSPDIYPEFGQCVHKLVMAADGGEHLYQQNHCGVYRSDGRRRAVGGDHAGAAVRVRLPDDGPPARPADGLDDPAQRRRPGPVHARRRRRPSGARTTAATPGSGRATACRSRTPTCGAARGDGQRRHRPGRRLLRDEHRPAVRQRRRGPHAGRWSPTTCRRSGPSRPPSLADGGSPAIVHLPRSLVALFPGTERRVEARRRDGGRGDRATSTARSRASRNRVLDAGPSLRSHLNVFVAGERAGLQTPVPAGADVHIIPAVSGG